MEAVFPSLGDMNIGAFGEFSLLAVSSVNAGFSLLAVSSLCQLGLHGPGG